MTIIDFLRQVSILLTLPVVVLMGAMAALLVIVRDWRLALFAYAIESSTVAVLLMQRLPMEWALLQAITGGLVAVMLFLSALQLRLAGRPGIGSDVRWPQLPSIGVFRLVAVLLALLAFLALRTQVSLPLVNPVFRDGILWLALAGALGLALHEEPLHGGLALLTVIGGFALLLFSLTQSRTLIGIVDGWQILLGLAISYLIVSRGLAEPAVPRGVAPLGWRR